MIVVGSTSDVKLEAVKAAVAELGLDVDVEGVKAASGVDEQPLGPVAFTGAAQRIEHAERLCPDAAVYVAIENGIFREGDAFVDRAVVMVKVGDQTEVTLSDGVVFPAEFVAMSVASNLTVTAGKYMAEAGFVHKHDDPHSDIDLLEWPGLRKSRADILRETLLEALKELV